MIVLSKKKTTGPKSPIHPHSTTHGSLVALEIRGEDGKGDGPAVVQAAHHFRVVGHLRHPLWRHKARGFNEAQSARSQPLDKLNLCRCREQLREMRCDWTWMSILTKERTKKSGVQQLITRGCAGVRTSFSFWSPSRGPTSTIFTLVGIFLHCGQRKREEGDWNARRAKTGPKQANTYH